MAAIGNGIFAFGQRKSVPTAHPFIFLTCALTVCIALFLIASLFFPKVDVLQFIQTNYPWFITSGAGFFLTFIGFYLLYTRFGASYYVLYAVLSILTTSVIVGLIIFREQFTLYHGLSICTAIVTIVLFALGNAQR
ncbi:transporter [candidate division KSB3 bacterium]|uniref:Transporter n=1 Tax=candidate division KSB3 bacterium TaxID=2044937 RepID=A0A9D5Q7U2_9BACT|nr:transporter [candidate division KSB3 bacterium]MBD3326803.1 transporter [candidate division KSB3 bacterium]